MADTATIAISAAKYDIAINAASKKTETTMTTSLEIAILYCSVTSTNCDIVGHGTSVTTRPSV